MHKTLTEGLLGSAIESDLLESLGGSPIEDSKELLVEEKREPIRPGITPARRSATEERAIELLGTGITAEAVAAALGVTQGRISQLLSDDAFSERVTALRYSNLKQHNERDAAYDTIEDKLIKKLEGSISFMLKPTDILNAIKVINGAKRRGQSAPEQVTAQQNIVNIVLPAIITQQFKTNINNQVVRAGEQELLTMPAGELLKQAEDAEEVRLTTTQDQLESKTNGGARGS